MARKGRPIAGGNLTWTAKTTRQNPATGNEERYGSFTKKIAGKRHVLVSCWESQQKEHRKQALVRLEELQEQLKLSPASKEKGRHKLRDVVHRYLASQSGKSSGHQYNLALLFRNYLEPMFGSTACKDFDAEFILDCREQLSKQLEKGTVSHELGNKIIKYLVSFTHFLYGLDYIPAVPKVVALPHMRSQLSFINRSPKRKRIPTIGQEEFGKLYRAATPQMRVWMELAFFTCFYQSDISDLKHSQVLWEQSLIVHKRVKTRLQENVPEVNYYIPALNGARLIDGWRPFMTNPKEHKNCFVNRYGTELTMSDWDAETGKGRRKNCIGIQFHRLNKKVGTNYSFGDIRNTTATLLHNEPNFTYLADHFLGHSPKTIATKHYKAVDDTNMCEAADFLADWFLEALNPSGEDEDTPAVVGSRMQ